MCALPLLLDYLPFLSPLLIPLAPHFSLLQPLLPPPHTHTTTTIHPCISILPPLSSTYALLCIPHVHLCHFFLYLSCIKLHVYPRTQHVDAKVWNVLHAIDQLTGRGCTAFSRFWQGFADHQETRRDCDTAIIVLSHTLAVTHIDPPRTVDTITANLNFNMTERLFFTLCYHYHPSKAVNVFYPTSQCCRSINCTDC